MVYRFQKIYLKKKRILLSCEVLKVIGFYWSQRGIKKIHIYEDKFEFKNQRCKPTFLAAPLLASIRANFAINSGLLTI